jgi:hypothetical protein
MANNRASEIGKIITVSGIEIFLPNIKKEDIRAWDIVWSLEGQNQYNNQTPVKWDVLSHSALMWIIANKEAQLSGIPLTPYQELAILLHDASEAYVGDLIRPIKKLMSEGKDTIYDDLEAKVMRTIEEAFGLPHSSLSSDAIEDLDTKAYCVEMAAFRKPLPEGMRGYPETIPLTKVGIHFYIEKLKELVTLTGLWDKTRLFEISEIMEPLVIERPPVQEEAPRPRYNSGEVYPDDDGDTVVVASVDPRRIGI